MSESMEKICKNCRNATEVMFIVNARRCKGRFIYQDDRACPEFAPIQEDNKEER